jgi:hypothetical protein
MLLVLFSDSSDSIVADVHYAGYLAKEHNMPVGVMFRGVCVQYELCDTPGDVLTRLAGALGVDVRRIDDGG